MCGHGHDFGHACPTISARASGSQFNTVKVILFYVYLIIHIINFYSVVNNPWVSFGDGFGDGIGDGFWDIRGDGHGELVTKGESFLSVFGVVFDILLIFGDAFVEIRIWAIWPILDDGFLT